MPAMDDDDGTLAALPSFADPDNPLRLHPTIAFLMAFGQRWIRATFTEEGLRHFGPQYAGHLLKIKSYRSTDAEDIICVKWGRKQRSESVVRPSWIRYLPRPADAPPLAEARRLSGHSR